jgi:N-methylhydantoinase B/oxoprolinase/acetone carboxylase alpha subunit
MIETQEGLTVSLEQLVKLRAWEKELVNDLNQNPRLKKSELAGIRRMIAQIEREIQSYNLTRLQNTINELEEQARKLKAEELPALLSQKLRAIREAANAMQPVM